MMTGQRSSAETYAKLDLSEVRNCAGGVSYIVNMR